MGEILKKVALIPGYVKNRPHETMEVKVDV
jgi:hypothetical protein